LHEKGLYDGLAASHWFAR